MSEESGLFKAQQLKERGRPYGVEWKDSNNYQWDDDVLRKLPASNSAEFAVLTVQMNTFNSLEDFKDCSNNFWARFDASCVMDFRFESMPCFKRFIALYPQLYLDILFRVSRMRWCSSTESHCITDNKEFPWELLFEVYQKMSKLVSAQDPFVIRKDEETVDPVYLCR